MGIIIAVLLLGILLILLEILFVPGTTIVGIGGLILLAIGIYLAYKNEGAMFGHMTVGAALFAILVSLVLLLKGKTWERLALKETIESSSGVKVHYLVAEGDKGVTIGRLNPSGKANFGNYILEVHTSGDLIDSDIPVEVVKVRDNRIQVQRI